MVNRESIGPLKIHIEGTEFAMFYSAESWLHMAQTPLFEERIRAASRSSARHAEYEALRFV